MSVFVFGKARSIVEQEAKQANDLLLKQMKSYLDTVVGEATQLKLLVSYNDRLPALLYASGEKGPDDYYRAYVLSNDFRTYGFAANAVVTFYVYFPRIDMILSPNGIFSVRSYLESHRELVGESADAWQRQFRGVNGTEFRSGKAENDSGALLDTIDMVSPLPVTGRDAVPHAWLVVSLDSRFFRQIFQHTSWTDQSILVVYDRSGGVVATSRPDALSGITDAQSRTLAGKPDAARVTLHGEQYVLLHQDSALADWRYLSFVPAHIYSNVFRSLVDFTVIAFAVSIAIGLLLIYWLATLRYRPVDRLLGMIPDGHARGPGARADEYVLIAENLRDAFERDRVLEERLLQARPIVAQRFMRQLLKGRAGDGVWPKSELAELGIRFNLPFLVLVLVEVEPSSPGPDDQRERDALLEFVESIEDHTVQVIRDLDGATGFLTTTGSADADGVFELAREAKQRVEKGGCVIVAVGVSGAHPISDGPQVLLTEAQAALRFRLVAGDDDPIRFHDVVPAGTAYFYPVEEEIRLINFIKTGDAEGAQRALEQIYTRNFRNVALSEEMARCLMFDLISTMVKTISSLDPGPEGSRLWSDIRPAARLTACRSFDQLRSEMSAILEKVCKSVRDGVTTHAERLRDDVVAFVAGHYSDKNLSSETIAAALDRNPEYLGRFFREQTSVGIAAHIKRTRVEAARKLLLEESMTIGEIAERVGFGGSNAFIRAFKEIQGVTPGQYQTATAAKR